MICKFLGTEGIRLSQTWGIGGEIGCIILFFFIVLGLVVLLIIFWGLIKSIKKGIGSD